MKRAAANLWPLCMSWNAVVPAHAGICGSEVADEQGLHRILHGFRGDRAWRLHSHRLRGALPESAAEAAPGHSCGSHGCRSATVVARLLQFGTVPRVLQSRSGTVVDPADPSWNLLLGELSRLSKIVERSTNDRDHGSSSTAAPELRER